MRILFAVNHYWPDGGTAAPLFTSLCSELAIRGHQITVITAVPHYPSGIVPKNYRSNKAQHSFENGIKVIRVPLPSLNRKKYSSRMIQFIFYQIGATIEGLRLEYDAFLTSSAAIQSLLPFLVLAVLRRRPSVYSVADIYPDVGVKSGIFKNKLIIHIIKILELFCLKEATKVRVLSKSFMELLISRGIQKSKCSLIYDWIDTSLFNIYSKTNSFSEKFGLQKRFVVLYAGNIGYIQDLSTTLMAAQILQNMEDICFVFVGDGVARLSLMEQAIHLGLTNTIFIPYQPFSLMPKIFSTADISLLSLLKGNGYTALPSKCYAIFSSGRPLIASVDKGCDTWNIVKKYEAGLCVEPGKPKQLAKAICILKNDVKLRDKMGRNGRIWAERYHSTKSAALRYEDLFYSAVKSHFN